MQKPVTPYYSDNIEDSPQKYPDIVVVKKCRSNQLPEVSGNSAD
jgi:hypothetical protein